MASIKCVIDTDCLNFLLNIEVGKKILNNCEIFLPPSIINELDQRQQNKLTHYNITIVELDENNKEYAAKIIQKINGKKQFKNWYLDGKYSKLIRSVGESEGAAISKKLNIDIIMLDKKATSTIKKTFKFLPIKCIYLKDFGIKILTEIGSSKDIKDYKEELRRKLHIFSND
ncbi:MAG: hypothetical protein ACTSRI_14040 [Promethearchaeota archaeon]